MCPIRFMVSNMRCSAGMTHTPETRFHQYTECGGTPVQFCFKGPEETPASTSARPVLPAPCPGPRESRVCPEAESSGSGGSYWHGWLKIDSWKGRCLTIVRSSGAFQTFREAQNASPLRPKEYRARPLWSKPPRRAINRRQKGGILLMLLTQFRSSNPE